MNRLQGKRTLITGGTTGIGLETARQFVAEGARVAVTGNNPETLAAARETLGADVLVLRSDAGDVGAQAALAAQIRQTLGGLDAVFVNAGIGDFRPIEAFDEAGFDRLFAINLKGPYFLLQALVPLLADPSSVVLTASVSAHLGMAMQSVYGASKAALLSLARTLSGELVGRGIRVNAVSPGPIAIADHGQARTAGRSGRRNGRPDPIEGSASPIRRADRGRQGGRLSRLRRILLRGRQRADRRRRDGDALIGDSRFRARTNRSHPVAHGASARRFG